MTRGASCAAACRGVLVTLAFAASWQLTGMDPVGLVFQARGGRVAFALSFAAVVAAGALAEGLIPARRRPRLAGAVRAALAWASGALGVWVGGVMGTYAHALWTTASPSAAILASLEAAGAISAYRFGVVLLGCYPYALVVLLHSRPTALVGQVAAASLTGFTVVALAGPWAIHFAAPFEHPVLVSAALGRAAVFLGFGLPPLVAVSEALGRRLDGAGRAPVGAAPADGAGLRGDITAALIGTSVLGAATSDIGLRCLVPAAFGPLARADVDGPGLAYVVVVGLAASGLSPLVARVLGAVWEQARAARAGTPPSGA